MPSLKSSSQFSAALSIQISRILVYSYQYNEFNMPVYAKHTKHCCGCILYMPAGSWQSEEVAWEIIFATLLLKCSTYNFNSHLKWNVNFIHNNLLFRISNGATSIHIILYSVDVSMISWVAFVITVMKTSNCKARKSHLSHRSFRIQFSSFASSSST